MSNKLLLSDLDPSKTSNLLTHSPPHPSVDILPFRVPGEERIIEIPFSHSHVSISYETVDPEAIDLGNRTPTHSRVLVFAGWVAVNGVEHEAALTIHERPNDITPSIELAIYDTESL